MPLHDSGVTLLPGQAPSPPTLRPHLTAHLQPPPVLQPPVSLPADPPPASTFSILEHLLCVSSHRCLSPFVIILVDCLNPGVRSQSKPRKLRLREVQTAVQDHPALDRQPSLDSPRDLPIHTCFPLANGQEKLPALPIVHCFSPTPVSNFRQNSTNQTNQKGKKKRLLVKLLCSIPSKDLGFFFGKSA